jgi:hypothetical protein
MIPGVEELIGVPATVSEPLLTKANRRGGRKGSRIRTGWRRRWRKARRWPRSGSREVAAGLTFRSLADTAASTLEFHHARDATRKAVLRPGVSADQERAVLEAWHRARQGQGVPARP